MDVDEKFFIDEANCVHCLDMSLNRDEKIKAVHGMKRDIKNRIYLSFADHIRKHPDEIKTWFSKSIDSENHNRICFSLKAIDYLRNEFKINRVKYPGPSMFFRGFMHSLKMSSGDSKFSIKKFIRSCAG